MKIYFAMSEFDLGCFEWDSIYVDKQKALDRLITMPGHQWAKEYGKMTDEKFREYAEKNFLFEAEVIE